MIGRHSENAPAMPLIADNSPTPYVVTTSINFELHGGKHAPGAPLTRAYPSAEYAPFNSFALPTTINSHNLPRDITPGDFRSLFNKV
jgi:hypothetical protein